MKHPLTSSCMCFDRCIIDGANQPRDKRNQSEDYILADPNRGLLGVFDSVGGRDNGLLISQLAGKTIASAWHSLSAAEQQGSPTQLETVLQAVIRQADTTIAALPLPSGQKRPATTVALGVLSVQHAEVSLTMAHVGDSRIYLLRAGQLQRLTEDNGYFPFAVRRGLLTQEESMRIEQAEHWDALSSLDQTHFAQRNRITCAVGWTDFSSIQTRSLILIPGDRILFCTDGIHDNLTDLEIEDGLRRSDEGSANQLVQRAYQRSHQVHFRAKQDDISAILVRYQ